MEKRRQWDRIAGNGGGGSEAGCARLYINIIHLFFFENLNHVPSQFNQKAFSHSYTSRDSFSLSHWGFHESSGGTALLPSALLPRQHKYNERIQRK